VLYRQAVQQAQTNLAQASADAELERALHARGDPSQQDFDFKTALAVSGAMAVDSAKITLETARLNLGYTTVSAPSAGYVTNLELGTGTYAAAGEPVVALVDADSYFGTQWPLLRR
jgi:multidrug resistance efflux pump